MIPDVQSHFETPKKIGPNPKKSYDFLITLVAIMFISGGYAIWFISTYLYAYDDAEYTYTPRVHRATAAEVATSTVDMTAWQTYRNEEYGFEFKYPQKWYLEKYSDSEIKSLAISNYPNTKSFDLGSSPVDLEQIFIWIEQKDNSTNLDSLKPIYTDNVLKVVSFEKIGTDKNEGRKLVVYSSDHPSGNHTSAFFLKNRIQIKFGLGVSSEDQQKLFNQVLSTFKFLP